MMNRKDRGRVQMSPACRDWRGTQDVTIEANDVLVEFCLTFASSGVNVTVVFSMIYPSFLA
jgi:hypothetical protein